MRAPRLLGKDFSEKARLMPVTLGVTRNLTPPSTATMALAEDEFPVSVGDFVEIYGSDDESIGIFRIRGIRTRYGDTHQADLEHGITTLEDCLISANASESETISGTPEAILAEILSHQKEVLWSVGNVAYDGGKIDLGTAGGSALSAFLHLLSLMDGYMASFDQSSLPWKINISHLPSEVSCECRVNRNLAGATVSVDRSTLCTRVYVEGLEGDYMDADTVSTFGVVERMISAKEGETAQETAEKYLRDHSVPAVSADVDALEVHTLSGDRMDRFSLGEICRLALPDWGITVEKKIVSIISSDLVSSPDRTRLSLSLPPESVATAVVSVQRQVKSQGGSISKLDEHIRYLDGLLEITSKDIDLIAVDIANIEDDVSQVGEDIGAAIIRLDGAEATILLQGQTLTQQGELISNTSLEIDGLDSRIAALAEDIQLEADRITLLAEEIDIAGYVTMDEVEARTAELFNAYIEVFDSQSISTGYLSAGSVEIDGGYASLGSLSTDSLSVGGTSYSKKSRYVLTSQPNLSLSKRYLSLMTADGGTVTLDIVTNATISASGATIYYLGS